MFDLPDHPALSAGLLTYLGNKRRVLPLIARGVMHARTRVGRIERALDLFAGSGVVARMLRIEGMRVHANDAEEFVTPFSRAMIEATPAAVDAAAGPGGYAALCRRANAIADAGPRREWAAVHYAPRNDDAPDWASERLFYTRANALRIDAIAEALHEGDLRDLPEPARSAVMAPLLVQAIVRSNTSGVMKGYHRGWGGRNGDALSRILAPVVIEPLPLIDGPVGVATSLDATDAARRAAAEGIADLAYLDPPYASHQYGANYHILTSLTRWDRWDPGPVRRGARAGIRTDHRRSPFCRRQDAVGAFERVLGAVRARAILVSYSVDGIVPLPTLAALLNDLGRTELLTRDHVRFRGGKHGGASTATQEVLFLVETERRADGADRNRLNEAARHVVERHRLRDRAIIPSRWRADGGAVYHTPEGRWIFDRDGIRIETRPDLSIAEVHGDGGRDVAAVMEIVERATGSHADVAEALIEERAWPAALQVARRLKIERDRAVCLTLLERLQREDVADAIRARAEKLADRLDHPPGIAGQ